MRIKSSIGEKKRRGSIDLKIWRISAVMDILNRGAADFHEVINSS